MSFDVPKRKSGTYFGGTKPRSLNTFNDLPDGTTEVFTTNGVRFLISTVDKQKLLDFKYTWSVTYSNRNKVNADIIPYIIAYPKGHRIRLHNFLLNPPKGFVVDHKNGDTLDHTRENLRVVTRKENNFNKKPYNKKSDLPTGIYFQANKYTVYIDVDRKRHHLGRYTSLEEAVQVRKQAEKEHYGYMRRGERE